MLIGSVDHTINQQIPYANKAENHQTVDAGDKNDNTSKIESSSDFKEPHDEYIPSGGEPEQSPGIYRLGKDENGRQKIVFDRPDSSEKSEQAGTAEKKANAPEKRSDKKDGALCTVSTDKVDAEIKKLKEEKQQIEQQLNSTRDDAKKQKELQIQLSQVTSELSAKDNDGYRKQQATYTNI